MNLEGEGLLKETTSVTVELFGSLAMTGEGHATDVALLLGLEGCKPEELDPSYVSKRVPRIRKERQLNLLGKQPVPFTEAQMIFHRGKRLPYHSNALRFRANGKRGKKLAQDIYYSVGGGFVVCHKQISEPTDKATETSAPYPFTTCRELLAHCEQTGLAIPDLVMENEKCWRTEEEIKEGILHIWGVMRACVERGCQQEGILPGGLDVKRRAAGIYRNLKKKPLLEDPSEIFDWVSLFALAVNEENAAGGRVVTAPTNGAAGIIPAVLHYFHKFCKNATDEGIIRFFLTATAVGILYKEGASLSAAEMGCQGEVGVACSMAAAGLTAALGGSNLQIENAAEIGMEHNLGLTCDPIAGLVQIPCIERNTMGAIQAINAARLALQGNGSHRVSLDQVIQTMRQTGEDMKTIYKETSEGGLALHVPVSIPEC